MMPRRLAVVGMLLVAIALSGCSAVVTGLKGKDLQVQTSMSEPIYLEPVSPDKRTVWVESRSMCDQPMDFSPLGEFLTARGYRVVADPEAAHHLLRVTCVRIEKSSRAAVDTDFGKGAILGMALLGAIAGAAIGDVTGFVGGAIGAGLGEALLGALVKEVTYTVVTDLQLSERSPIPVVQEQTATLTQGTQTQLGQQVGDTAHWKHYRNRITSTATRVNLDFEDARSLLVQGLLKSLAGIL